MAMRFPVLVGLIIAAFLIGSLGTFFLHNPSPVTIVTTSTATETSTNTLFQPVTSTATYIQTTSISNASVITAIKTSVVTQNEITTVTRAHALSLPLQSSFSFNETAALAYFKALNTTTGLLRDYRNDSHIYLADDQALDYNALKDISLSTGDPSALQLAVQINASMTQIYGGLYQLWNPVFLLFGQHPTNVWNVTTGYNEGFPSNSGFSINATIFPTNSSHPIEIKQYADIALYYILWNTLVANATNSNMLKATSSFNALQTECVNYGCQDAGYFSPSVPSTVVYSSYKVALDLIVYKELENSGAFAAINNTAVNETINRLMYVANELQAPDGGVYTSYNAYGDNIAPFGLGSSNAENGETTALFTLAYHLWNTGRIT